MVELKTKKKKMRQSTFSEENQRPTSFRTALIIPLSKSVINRSGFNSNFNLKAAFFNALKTKIYVPAYLSLRRIQATGSAAIERIHRNRATDHSIK